MDASAGSEKTNEAACGECDADLRRKDSPSNPYNASICSRTRLEWPLEENVDEFETVDGSFGLDRFIPTKLNLDACPCAPVHPGSSSSNDRECCVKNEQRISPLKRDYENSTAKFSGNSTGKNVCVSVARDAENLLRREAESVCCRYKKIVPGKYNETANRKDNEDSSGKDRKDFVATIEGCCKAEWARQEHYIRVKEKVERAVRRHKIFLIRGELPKLKEALEERGWVQKYEAARTRTLPYGSVAALEARSLGDIQHPDGTLNEKALTFALLRRATPDFVWDCRNDFVDWQRGVKSNTLLNRYQRPSVYTSKLGMARLLEDSHWLHESGVSSVLFPRSYDPSRDTRGFVDDFRLTAAAGFLKWFVERSRSGRDVAYEGRHPVPVSRLEFAVKACEEFVAEVRNKNLDREFGERASDKQWAQFLDDFEAVVHRAGGIENATDGSRDRIQKCYLAAASTLKKLKSVDPQYELNGMRNAWILKPSDLCCGTGISISHNLKEILRKVEDKPKDYFVVQKYIERPLLIQETKFDIRAWYLVTCTLPLTIWMFNEPLLRFSSKPYTYSSYHEAIHICNTAIQEKYDDEKRRRRRRGVLEESGKTVRDQGWDCQKLNEYLKREGHEGDPYYDRIHPKMAEAIVLTMLASQEHMDRRRCSFELYGADFVLMDDLSVWIIEINTNPRMHPPSSRVTKRLYGAVLDSLVRVVLDLPADPRADTGGFRLVYRQHVPEFEPYMGPGLFVSGKSVALQERRQKRERERVAGSASGPWARQHRAWTAPPLMPRAREPRVVDFIDCLAAARCTAAN